MLAGSFSCCCLCHNHKEKVVAGRSEPLRCLCNPLSGCGALLQQCKSLCVCSWLGEKCPCCGGRVGNCHVCAFVSAGASLQFLSVAFQCQSFQLLWCLPTVPWECWQAAVDDACLICCNLNRHCEAWFSCRICKSPDGLRTCEDA